MSEFSELLKQRSVTLVPRQLSRRTAMLEGDRTLFKYVRSRNSQISRPDVVSGSTPPGVFVGRFGYPKVFVGPMVPRIYGDTSLLDTPEMWRGKTIEDIVDYRYSLVRGCSRWMLTKLLMLLGSYLIFKKWQCLQGQQTRSSNLLGVQLKEWFSTKTVSPLAPLPQCSISRPPAISRWIEGSKGPIMTLI